MGIRDEKDLENSRYKGDIYETFVFAELLKQITYSQNIMELFYYRTQDKKEIDFIIKRQDNVVDRGIFYKIPLSTKSIFHIGI